MLASGAFLVYFLRVITGRKRHAADYAGNLGPVVVVILAARYFFQVLFVEFGSVEILFFLAHVFFFLPLRARMRRFFGKR